MLHQLLAILAAPQPGPPIPTPAKIGPAGEWFLPAVIITLSLGIDATKAGDAAKRDRFAAALTYAGTLGLIAVYGWAATIQGWLPAGWSWALAGSAFAFTVHVMFVLVLFGHRTQKFSRQAAWLASRAGVGAAPAPSTAAAGPTRTAGASGGGPVGRINTKLHAWAVVAACSYVLARGDAAAVPKGIGTVLTGVSGAIGQWVVARLGG